MALRHAVLAALADRRLSAYELARRFDVTVAHFWHATAQQLSVELARMEAACLVVGHEVVRDRRPTKRVFTIASAGADELAAFIERPTRPTAIKDDLTVAVHAAEFGSSAAVLRDLAERREQAEVKLADFHGMAREMLAGRTEEEYLETAERIGPYLALRRGIAFEEQTAAWCESTAHALSRRLDRARRGT
ncbi:MULTISPECIES: PadR family transcriptional regulator [Actinoalloteichus]|uniref:Transcriptional regulator n=1 Tax=Actinoalloteichus fjordicus TaxID=1612552 RepID=A0AAC9LBJ7_9PSEU|nr:MULTISPECIES: helix-turn-helix transcriptional regulator [Actinoalloteichus]APU14547.1 putative transcriptional regulator [Actinoalloteichus fjordicus]APU20515.1 putative transcriptional regulator [Actinoalloteichus sp. GBA129-24]